MILDLDTIISDFWKHALPKDASGYLIHDDELIVDLLEFTYEKFDVTKAPTLVGSMTYSNGSDTQATQTISQTESTTSTSKWSVTAGVKVGAKTQFKVSAPIFAEGKVEASIELSLAGTHEQTTTQSQAWSYSVSVPVPAHTRVEADLIVSMAKYSPNWRARVLLGGASYITVGDNPRHKTVPITAILKDQPGVRIEGNVAYYDAAGTFKGTQGLSTEVVTTQHPYTVAQALEEIVTVA